MNPREKSKLLLICILFSYRLDLVSCADGQGGTESTTGKTQPTTNSPTKVELDIDKDTKATDQFDYFKNTSIDAATYTCKEAFGFSVVKHGNTEIWKPDSEGTNLYAKKVTVHGAGKNKHALTVLLSDGKTVKFSRPDDGKPYTKVEEKTWDGTKAINKSEHPSKVKITVEGSSAENDTDKYKVYKEGDLFTYVFNDGVKCTKIKHDNKDVWTYNSNDDLCPKSIEYNSKDKKLHSVFQFGPDSQKLVNGNKTGTTPTTPTSGGGTPTTPDGTTPSS